jgi:hypothetical protein
MLSAAKGTHMPSDGHDEFDDEAAAPDEWENAVERIARQAGLVPNPG